MQRSTKQKRSYAGFLGANGGNAPEAPSNDTAPSITGTATVGETLTADDGGWSGVETPSLARQWQRDDEPIEGETASTYELLPEDEGAVITVVVTARNWAGFASETSAGTDEVAGA